MADTTNKTQVNVLLSHEAEDLLRALHEAKQEEAGLTVSLSAYVEMLVRQEGKRQGIKSRKGAK